MALRLNRQGVGLSVVVNAPAPYRVYLHERIAREIPEVDLTSVFLAEGNNQNWKFNDLSHIGAIQMGAGESVGGSGSGLGRKLRAFRKGVRVIRELRRRQTEALIVCGYSELECFMSLLWAKAAGVPVFLWSDSNIKGDRATGLKRFIKNAVVSRIVKAVTGVLPVGSMGRAYYARYGATPEKTFTVPIEGDMSTFQNVPDASVDTVRVKYGLDEERRRMVCSGRLDPVKGYDTAIEAFNEIADERPDWDLVMCGDGELRQDLESRVRPDLKHRVIWTGFIQSQAELAAIYKCCDILVHPARKDAFAVVIQEAVAAGLVVIASENTGAAADLVDDMFNGRIVPSDDREALVEAMIDATTPCRLSQMKRAAERQLDQWYEESDAIEGVREALEYAGVLDDPEANELPRRVALAAG